LKGGRFPTNHGNVARAGREKIFKGLVPTKTTIPPSNKKPSLGRNDFGCCGVFYRPATLRRRKKWQRGKKNIPHNNSGRGPPPAFGSAIQAGTRQVGVEPVWVPTGPPHQSGAWWVEKWGGPGAPVWGLLNNGTPRWGPDGPPLGPLPGLCPRPCPSTLGPLKKRFGQKRGRWKGAGARPFMERGYGKLTS